MSSVQGDLGPQDDPAPKKKSIMLDFVNPTSFLLVSALVSMVIIIVVLALTGAVDSTATVLGAVSSVIVALGGVIVATSRCKP